MVRQAAAPVHPHSPLEGLQLPRRQEAANGSSTDAELAQVWRAAEAQGYPHGQVIQLLILTGQRKSEIGSLSRPWIDEKGAHHHSPRHHL